MGKEMNEKIVKWLNGKFLDLQKQSETRWTVTEFAEYLDCPQPQVSRWLMGKAIPNDTYIERIAKLGDDIYDLVGRPRPDPDLKYVEMNWETIPPDVRKSIRLVAEKAVKKYAPRSDAPARGMAAPDET